MEIGHSLTESKICEISLTTLSLQNPDLLQWNS